MTYGNRRTVALWLLCLAQLMCVLDISIVNIAIPSIQRELSLASSSLQWLLTAYVLTYGGFLLIGGRLGDLYGRRRMLFFGLTLFTVASALGGLSTNVTMLLLARAGQGLGGAVITPTVLAFITGIFPEGADRNRALGLLGAVTGAGFALGLVLGGLLTSTLGWRWVFFINLPIAMGVIGGAAWLLQETRRERTPVDVPGAVLATAALALTTCMLAGTEQFGLLSGRTVASAAAAAGLFYLFVRVQRRAAHPLIPFGLLRHKPLITALVGSTTFGAVIGPSTFFLTQYLQNVSGLSPLWTGLAFMPQEVLVFATANLAGTFVTRYGARNVLAAGIGAFAAGSLLLSRMSASGVYMDSVFPGLMFAGLGIGAVGVAGSISATEGVPLLQHGLAAGIWNTGQQIGTALGLAILSATAGARTNALLLRTPHMSDVAATVAGYNAAFLVSVGFAVLGLVALFGVKRSPDTVAEGEVGAGTHRARA